MIPYKLNSFKLIKPHSVYTYSPEAKEYFFYSFGEDQKSFDFLHYLVRYCCERNQDEWPTYLTKEVLDRMSKDAGYPVLVEETKLFADGYLIKNSDAGTYELTHEFVVLSFLSCPDGNFLPLSTGHINFKDEDKISTVLREEFFIKEPQAVTFLTKLAVDLSKQRGTLIDRKVSLNQAIEVAKDNDLILELCLEWAQDLNLISIDVEEQTLICNGLMLVAYQASPKLN